MTVDMAFLANELHASFCFDASISSIVTGGINATPTKIRVNPYVGSVEEVCAMVKDRSEICLAVVDTVGKYHHALYRHMYKDFVDPRALDQLLTSGIDIICLTNNLIVTHGINTIPNCAAKLAKRRRIKCK